MGHSRRPRFDRKWKNRQYLLINLLEAPVLAVLLAFILRALMGECLQFWRSHQHPALPVHRRHRGHFHGAHRQC